MKQDRFFRLIRWFARLWVSEHMRVMLRLTQNGFASALFHTALVLALLIGFGGGLAFLRSFPQDNFALEMAVLLLLGLILCCGVWGVFALGLARHSFDTVDINHAIAPGEAMGVCVDWLNACGFSIVLQSGNALRAVRGETNFVPMAEREWKAAPMELNIAVTPDGEGSAVRVTCFAPAGTHARFRRLRVATAKAAASLDKAGQAALDREILSDQKKARMGALAARIMVVSTGSALLSGVVVGGLGLLIAWNLLATESDQFLLTQIDQSHDSLVANLTGRLFGELVRVHASLPAADGSGQRLLDALAGIQFAGLPGEPVVALRKPGNVFSVLRPASNHPLHAQVTPELFSLGVAFGKVGDQIYFGLPWPEREAIRQRLALDKGVEIMIGVLLPAEFLASVVRSNYYAREMRFYHRGQAFARIEFADDGRRTSHGAKGIAEEARRLPRTMEFAFQKQALDHRASMNRESRDWDDFMREAWRVVELVYPTRRPEILELDGGATEVYRISYDDRTGAMNGHAMIFRARYGRWPLWDALFVLAMLVFAALTMVPGIWAQRVAMRIGRPILEVRDAMRSIAMGDYSVRVTQTGTDEIGQLQNLLNHTAEELKKREAIKELMGKYLSRQVADRIMAADAGDAMMGIRREVSILFADVRGFTSFSEKHDPERVTRSLNEYFEVMVDVIASHDGVLDKFIGDGLMVVFGAPVPQPDHARRAVITALEMQAALQSLNLRRAQKGDEPIAIGIGVNTGLAISGNLGSLKRMEFTVIGDTVNTAARLESQAAKGQVLVGKATYEMVREQVDAESLGAVTVKGKSEPVEVWHVRGLKPSPG
jgi:class 3 adenylate cyclase